MHIDNTEFKPVSCIQCGSKEIKMEVPDEKTKQGGASCISCGHTVKKEVGMPASKEILGKVWNSENDIYALIRRAEYKVVESEAELTKLKNLLMLREKAGFKMSE